MHEEKRFGAVSLKTTWTKERHSQAGAVDILKFTYVVKLTSDRIKC